jgi:hypothetical protein
MFTFNYLRRRVSIEHSHGRVSVFIAPGNRQTVYLFALVWFSLGMFFLVSIFIEPLLHSGFSRSVLPVLLMFILVVGGCLYVMRALVFRALGVDEIVIQGGRLQWTSRALWLKQQLELPASEISDVKAVTPWHAMRNHVEFTSGKRRYVVGDSLMHDETLELAAALKHAVGGR